MYIYMCIYMIIYIYMAIYIYIYTNIYIFIFGRQCGLPFQAFGLSSLSVIQPMICSAAAQWPRQNVWGTPCRCVKAPAQGMAQPYLVLAPGSAPNSGASASLPAPSSSSGRPLSSRDTAEDSGPWTFTSYSFLPLECYH